MIDYVAEHRERQMRHPEQYIENLRQGAMKRNRWIGELQERIRQLEAELKEAR